MQNENSVEIINAVYLFELRGIKLYENLKDKDPIFAQILAIKSNGLALLNVNEADKNLECYFDSSNSQSVENSLIKALNYEIELNAFYETATDSITDENFKDICFRLWATSHNEYIPALKMKLYEELNGSKALNFNDADYESHDDCDEDKYKKEEKKNQNLGFIFDQKAFGEMSEKIERIASGRGSREDMISLLNNPNFSFFSGLALGGMAGVLLNKMINKEDKEENA